MSKEEKVLLKILRGTSDANIAFSDLCLLLRQTLFCDTGWLTRVTMSKYKYEVIIYWSDEDEAFIAEVPELAGCAADGTTYEEVLDNLETIMDEWIETAQELGRPIPEPKGRLIFA